MNVLRRIIAYFASLRADAEYMSDLRHETHRIYRKAIRDAEHSAEFHEENPT